MIKLIIKIIAISVTIFYSYTETGIATTMLIAFIIVNQHLNSEFISLASKLIIKVSQKNSKAF